MNDLIRGGELMRKFPLRNTDPQGFRNREKTKVRRLLLAFSGTILCVPGFTILIEEIVYRINPHERFMATHVVAMLLSSITAAVCSFFLYRKFDFFIRRLLQAMTEQQYTDSVLRSTVNELQHSEQIAIALLGPPDMRRILKTVANGLVLCPGLTAALVACVSPETTTVTAVETAFASEKDRDNQGLLRLPLCRTWASALRNSEIARRILLAETVITADCEDQLASYLLNGNKATCRKFIYCPIRVGNRVNGFVAAGTAGEAFSPEQLASIARTVHLAAVAMNKANLTRSVREQKRDLRVLCARLEEVEEKERKLLAGELHDQIGPNLTALGINLHFIRNLLHGEYAKALEPRFEDSFKLLKELADRTRNIIANVYPRGLTDRGLSAALRDLCDRFSQRSEIGVELDLAEPEFPLARESELILYRIVLEGLNNIARHSEATEAKIHLGYEAGCLKLMISDNGKGIPAPEEMRSHDRPTWGLRSMRERTESIGGRFRIESGRRLGTQIHVEVPV